METNNQLLTSKYDIDFTKFKGTSDFLYSEEFQDILEIILMSNFPFKEAHNLRNITKKILGNVNVNKFDKDLLKELLLNEEFINSFKKYLNNNNIELLFDCAGQQIKPKISYNEISWLLTTLIIKQEVNDILLEKDDKETEKVTKTWRIIYEDEDVYVYNHWNKDYLINKKNPKIKLEFDNIEYNSNYWFKVRNGENYGILDLKWKELIPCEYLEIEFKYDYFEVTWKNGVKWVCKLDWEKIIECLYDFTVYNKHFWYLVFIWNTCWAKDFDWNTILDDIFSDIKYNNWKQLHTTTNKKWILTQNVYNLCWIPIFDENHEKININQNNYITRDNGLFTFFNNKWKKIISNVDLWNFNLFDISVLDVIDNVGIIIYNSYDWYKYLINEKWQCSEWYEYITYKPWLWFFVWTYEYWFLKLNWEVFLKCKYDYEDINFTNDLVTTPWLIWWTREYSKEQINL